MAFRARFDDWPLVARVCDPDRIRVAMSDLPISDAARRRFTTVVTFVIAGTVAVTAYRVERARERWWDEINPTAAPTKALRRQMRRFRNGGELLAELIDQVGRSVR
jgi:hypothetical protein